MLSAELRKKSWHLAIGRAKEEWGMGLMDPIGLDGFMAWQGAVRIMGIRLTLFSNFFVFCSTSGKVFIL